MGFLFVVYLGKQYKNDKDKITIMKVKEVIQKLSSYNQDAEFQVIAHNTIVDYEFTIGNSEGCTPKNCESVSIYTLSNTETL